MSAVSGTIALLDYGAGNVGSVAKAIEYLGYAPEIVSRPERLESAHKIVFPGQGHFGQMMGALRERGIVDLLRKAILGGKPFFGICLGLQALYEGSEEAPGVPGLALLAGQVTRFEGVFKVPHLGWSQIEITRSAGLLQGVADRSFAYFCHSYYGPVTPETVAVTEYGQRYASVVESGNIWAVQFHPEKSGKLGLRILKNFLEQE